MKEIFSYFNDAILKSTNRFIMLARKSVLKERGLYQLKNVNNREAGAG